MANDATLHDVARRVGVSPRTVSRVVNDQGGFSDATRARVMDAIAEVGYRPNLLARGLITRRSNTFGLVVAEMADPFFTEFADGVQMASRAVGRTMFLASTDNDRARQREVLRSFWSHAVDGIIIFPVRGTEREVSDLANSGTPIVAIDYPYPIAGVGSISADLHDGAVRAVRYLLATGRRRVAMISHDPPEANWPQRREAGYREAMAAAGVAVDGLLVHGPNTVDGGRHATERLLARRPDVDAVFAYNDLMAIGALRALQAAGRAVPADVAVVGFDDIAICEVISPRLTTVRIDRDQLGRAAVDLLSRLIDDPKTELQPPSLGVELVVRDST